MSDGRRDGAERRRGGDRRRRTRVRIAAVGDFHCGTEDAGAYRELFARADDEADLLLLAGDLTRHGTVAEMHVAVGELADVKVPILAVLGNHDHESGEVEEVTAVLKERGVRVLDGEPCRVDEHVGVAGVKGFMGGFERRTLTAFGEAEIKRFVGVALEEVQKLEFALRRLDTPVRLALLHYAPVAGTVAGEPEQIYPFLGNDRLAEPLDRFGVTAAFHGHAHYGTFRGETPGGVPVFNVSHALLRRDGIAEMFYVHEVPLPAPGAEAADEEEAVTSGSPGSA